MGQTLTAPCAQGPRAANSSGPRRASQIKFIVVHSAEASDDIGADTTAEGVANYFSRPSTQASTQLAVDRDSCVRMLSDLVIPWGAAGANTTGLHVEICGRAKWTRQEWLSPQRTTMLDRAAYRVAEWCYTYDIPARWVGPLSLRLGRKGITTHYDVNQAFKRGSHWDPGPGFPKDEFLAWVKEHLEDIRGTRRK